MGINFTGHNFAWDHESGCFKFYEAGVDTRQGIPDGSAEYIFVNNPDGVDPDNPSITVNRNTARSIFVANDNIRINLTGEGENPEIIGNDANISFDETEERASGQNLTIARDLLRDNYDEYDEKLDNIDILFGQIENNSGTGTRRMYAYRDENDDGERDLVINQEYKDMNLSPEELAAIIAGGFTARDDGQRSNLEDLAVRYSMSSVYNDLKQDGQEDRVLGTLPESLERGGIMGFIRQFFNRDLNYHESDTNGFGAEDLNPKLRGAVIESERFNLKG